MLKFARNIRRGGPALAETGWPASGDPAPSHGDDSHRRRINTSMMCGQKSATALMQSRASLSDGSHSPNPNASVDWRLMVMLLIVGVLLRLRFKFNGQLNRRTLMRTSTKFPAPQRAVSPLLELMIVMLIF